MDNDLCVLLWIWSITIIMRSFSKRVHMHGNINKQKTRYKTQFQCLTHYFPCTFTRQQILRYKRQCFAFAPFCSNFRIFIHLCRWEQAHFLLTKTWKSEVWYVLRTTTSSMYYNDQLRLLLLFNLFTTASKKKAHKTQSNERAEGATTTKCREEERYIYFRLRKGEERERKKITVVVEWMSELEKRRVLVREQARAPSQLRRQQRWWRW